MSEEYEAWAQELLKFVDEQNREIQAKIEKLAKKLEEDLCNDIVGDWFCADCDYKRRAEA